MAVRPGDAARHAGGRNRRSRGGVHAAVRNHGLQCSLFSRVRRSPRRRRSASAHGGSRADEARRRPRASRRCRRRSTGRARRRRPRTRAGDTSRRGDVDVRTGPGASVQGRPLMKWASSPRWRSRSSWSSRWPTAITPRRRPPAGCDQAPLELVVDAPHARRPHADRHGTGPQSARGRAALRASPRSSSPSIAAAASSPADARRSTSPASRLATSRPSSSRFRTSPASPAIG